MAEMGEKDANAIVDNGEIQEKVRAGLRVVLVWGNMPKAMRTRRRQQNLSVAEVRAIALVPDNI